MCAINSTELLLNSIFSFAIPQQKQAALESSASAAKIQLGLMSISPSWISESFELASMEFNLVPAVKQRRLSLQNATQNYPFNFCFLVYLSCHTTRQKTVHLLPLCRKGRWTKQTKCKTLSPMLKLIIFLLHYFLFNVYNSGEAIGGGRYFLFNIYNDEPSRALPLIIFGIISMEKVSGRFTR